MNRKTVFVLNLFWAFLFCFVLCPLALGQSAVRRALEPFIDRGELPGVVSVLANSDGTLSIESVGWADIEKKTPMTPDKMFWIASMSKQITAAGILILVDEGKLSLDDPVEKYLPEFQNVRVGVKNDDGTVLLRKPTSAMTIRQVLSHTAGWPFLTPTMQQFGIDSLPARLLASTAVQVPLLSDPGTKYQYSNVGIDIASAVIEVVSGLPFEQFLQKRIFDPLEMSDTTFWPSEEQLERMAKPYDISSGKCVLETRSQFTKRPFNDRVHRFAEGGGGLFSTPLDVIKFFQMIANKGEYKGIRILSEQAVETFASKQTGDQVPDNYSLGMRIEGDWFGHNGAWQTDGMANYKTRQARLYFVQITGIWSPPAKAAWGKAVEEDIK